MDERHIGDQRPKISARDQAMEQINKTDKFLDLLSRNHIDEKTLSEATDLYDRSTWNFADQDYGASLRLCNEAYAKAYNIMFATARELCDQAEEKIKQLLPVRRGNFAAAITQARERIKINVPLDAFRTASDVMRRIESELATQNKETETNREFLGALRRSSPKPEHVRTLESFRDETQTTSNSPTPPETSASSEKPSSEPVAA